MTHHANQNPEHCSHFPTLLLCTLSSDLLLMRRHWCYDLDTCLRPAVWWKYLTVAGIWLLDTQDSRWLLMAVFSPGISYLNRPVPVVLLFENSCLVGRSSKDWNYNIRLHMYCGFLRTQDCDAALINITVELNMEWIRRKFTSLNGINF